MLEGAGIGSAATSEDSDEDEIILSDAQEYADENTYINEEDEDADEDDLIIPPGN